MVAGAPASGGGRTLFIRCVGLRRLLGLLSGGGDAGGVLLTCCVSLRRPLAVISVRMGRYLYTVLL